MFHHSDKSEGEIGGADTIPDIFYVIGNFADGSTFPHFTAFDLCHALMDMFPKLDEFFSVFFIRYIPWRFGLFIDVSQNADVTTRRRVGRGEIEIGERTFQLQITRIASHILNLTESFME
jgi:hypothetical protein